MEMSEPGNVLEPRKFDFDKPCFDTIEFAYILGCAPYTVRRSRSTGILLGKKAPPYKKKGGKVTYPNKVAFDFEAQFDLQESTAQNQTPMASV